MSGYKLSILLITYNHEKYIDQAMQSIFGQLNVGPVELVVADDGSSDETRSIIKSYENADPRFHFKYLDHFPNLGITKNYQRGFAACSGKYVAVLEGDDYWCSPQKLQRQSDFLDSQWQCDLCAVNYYVYEELRSQFTPRTTAGKDHRFIGARSLIADNLVGNFSTCMYRKTALSKLPVELFDVKSYDWIVNICIAKSSLIGFLDEPMSVYRLHSAGVWTQSSQLEKLKLQLELIPAYDEITAHTFADEFNELSDRLKHAISTSYVTQAAGIIVQPVTSNMSVIKEIIPPILLSLINGLLPPVVKRFLMKLLGKSRST